MRPNFLQEVNLSFGILQIIVLKNKTNKNNFYSNITKAKAFVTLSLIIKRLLLFFSIFFNLRFFW